MQRQALDMPVDWMDAPAEQPAFLPDVARLLNRAVRRWRTVLAVAVVLDATAVVLIGYVPQLFSSRVVMLVIEGGVAMGGAPPPTGRIREQINQAAFSNRNLLAVMEKFELAERLRKTDPERAVESFRENVQIEIWRNEFLEERSAELRSVHLAISYHDSDPERARQVARALSDLAVDTTQAQRTAQVESMRTQIGTELAAIQRALQTRTEDEERLRLQMSRKDPLATEAAIDLLFRARERLQVRYQEAQARRARLDVALAAERESLGLQFIEIEPPAAQERSDAGPVRKLLWAGLGLVVALLFVGLFIGATDDHIYREADLSRLGLTLLAAVPHGPRRRSGEREAVSRPPARTK